MAGRIISGLTFSLEMPPGTWASTLWLEMTGLLLGAAVVKSYPFAFPVHPPPALSLFHSLLLFLFFPSPYEAFQPCDDSHFKGQGSHLSLSPY